MVLSRVFRHKIRHDDVFCDEIHVIVQHMSSQKNYDFDFMLICLFTVANKFIVFAFETFNFDHIRFCGWKF